MKTHLHGLITASHGFQYLVEADGQIWQCVSRGKQKGYACGDEVLIQPTSPQQAVIEKTLARRNLLYRSVAHRSKLIAANVDQIVVVLAPEPTPYELLLNRCLVAAEDAGIPAIICLNKSDLTNAADDWMQRLSIYPQLGYPVLRLSALHDIHPLQPWLEGKTSVLVGQSGMGKSSLVNALVPNATSSTGAISTALDSGRHTTTGARLYFINPQTRLIDSPGMQVFGLCHIQAGELDHLFPEFRPYIGQCRFNNCRHLQEPGCAIQNAVATGQISTPRIQAYQSILQG